MHVSRVHHQDYLFRIYWKKEYVGAMPSFPGKLRKRETFERWGVFALFISPQQVTQACEQTGDLQHRHSSNLSSSTFRKPGLSSGPAAIWNEESNLCCLLHCSMAHTSDPGTLLLPWRLPLTRGLGTDRGLSSSNRLQLMLQAELVGFATENTKRPLHLLTYV